MHGGAMKPTTCGQWCHIVCAIACPEVQFVDKTKRGPIDIRLLNSARRKLVVLILVFVFVFFAISIQCSVSEPVRTSQYLRALDTNAFFNLRLFILNELLNTIA